ncbi:PAS domain-containing protein [Acidimangrovimonas sediminis]|uniref:PAS domain-containing protein n=1 Tax=Acidimangrovimonas sediminis TaxID=2056283 RepID=UPI001305009D|nr:PAS domain-containing protein [Acidimangrovimonas sediminis]
MSLIDFERVFAALPSPYMLLDRDLRYVAANQSYLEATGRTLEDLLGQHIMEQFPNPGESGRRLEESLRKVLATGEADTLAYLPYPIANEDGTLQNRYWTAVHTPVYDAAQRVAYVLQNTVDVTEFARLRATSSPFPSLLAETSLIERTLEAEERSAEFRQLFQQAPAFFAVLSGPDHIFTFTSDSYVRLIGGREVIGQPVAEALPEVVGQGFVTLLDRVYAEGRAHAAEGARVMLATSPDGPVEEVFLDFSYNPVRDSSGQVTGIFVQGMDRTDSVRAHQRQRRLIDELNHRVKNTLAIVQSIASLTLRSVEDLATFREDFAGRISALARAHDMLSARHWESTDLETIVREELGEATGATLSISGPRRLVDAKTTVALALMLHEMSVNARRHGALSRPGGALSVSWQDRPDGALALDWQERGGPEVVVPTRTGFGTRLLRATAAGELGGTIDLRYPPEGFSATLVLPAPHPGQPEGPAPRALDG